MRGRFFLVGLTTCLSLFVVSQVLAQEDSAGADSAQEDSARAETESKQDQTDQPSLQVGDSAPQLKVSKGKWINTKEAIEFSTMKSELTLIVFQTVW